MKRSLITKSIFAIVLVLIVGFAFVGCEFVNGFVDGYNGIVNNDNQQPDGGNTEHIHEYSEEITTAPTCTEAGEKIFTCSCGDNYTEAIDALGHTEETVAGKDATCTEKGLTEGKKCSVCDETLVAQEEIAALGHTEETVAGKDATCTEKGLTEGKKCSVCSEVLVAQEEIDALGHTEETVAGKDATCTENGLTEGKKCTVCSVVTVEQEVINALGHKDEDGNFVCDVCEVQLCTEHTAADAIEEKRVEATCTKEGSYDLVVKCSKCGHEISRETKVIPVASHTEETVAGKAATCTETGLTDGIKCSVCGATVKAQEEIPALDHDMITDEAKAPTCTETGLTEGSHCSRCDYKIAQQEVPVASHTEETVAGKAATCTETGLTDGIKCSVCGATVKAQEEIPALDHDMITDEAKAPDCENVGLTEGSHCSRCDHKVAQQEIPALGHKYDNKYDTTCNVCDHVREIDTTANELVNGGFENGLEGWTLVGNIGSVSSDKNYWVNDPESAEGFAFGMDGDKMFSAYAPGAEERAVGTLTSSSFLIGGSGFVTFKLGAMRDANYVYVDVVDAETKQILARYYNGLWAERTDDVKSGCTLIAYKADLSAFMDREVFFRISDNADSGYGLFFVDSFVTFYANEPEGFNTATAVEYEISGTIYDVFNGGFEMGDVQGWWNIGEIGLVTNANGYWADNIPYGKHGDFLFTGVESNGADTMREGNRGTLTSSMFEIGGTGYISFMLGGGGNEHCYVQVIDAVTGDVLARYHQQAQQDAKLIQYVADLSAHIGKSARIQVVDLASQGWGCVSFDNVVTYYASVDALPEGITANNIFHGNYDVTNGSFENGLDGWHQNIWDAGAQNTLGWVESTEHDAGWYTKNDSRKDGNNLFTFCKPDGTNCENTKGELVSSTFTLKQGSFVSFRFGGAGTREVRVELVRADGQVIATFFNEAPGKVNTEMYAYFYQYNGETTDCFFRVVDDSTSNYGCFVVDDFRANLESAPEGFIAAIQ